MAVIERNVRWERSTETEPVEAGWAGEARWFVRVLSGDSRWVARVQISPDGQVWCDHGATIAIDGPGLYTASVREFGHWLRLVLDPGSAGVETRLHVYLSLKE